MVVTFYDEVVLSYPDSIAEAVLSFADTADLRVFSENTRDYIHRDALRRLFEITKRVHSSDAFERAIALMKRGKERWWADGAERFEVERIVSPSSPYVLDDGIEEGLVFLEEGGKLKERAEELLAKGKYADAVRNYELSDDKVDYAKVQRAIWEDVKSRRNAFVGFSRLAGGLETLEGKVEIDVPYDLVDDVLEAWNTSLYLSYFQATMFFKQEQDIFRKLFSRFMGKGDLLPIGDDAVEKKHPFIAVEAYLQHYLPRMKASPHNTTLKGEYYQRVRKVAELCKEMKLIAISYELSQITKA